MWPILVALPGMETEDFHLMAGDRVPRCLETGTFNEEVKKSSLPSPLIFM